jgi:hypothetical protein
VKCSEFDTGLARNVIYDMYKYDIEICLGNVQEILQAADFYLIHDLKERCVEFLLASISCKMCLQFMILKMSFQFCISNVFGFFFIIS